jgi:hypothetical protein
MRVCILSVLESRESRPLPGRLPHREGNAKFVRHLKCLWSVLLQTRALRVLRVPKETFRVGFLLSGFFETRERFEMHR